MTPKNGPVNVWSRLWLQLLRPHVSILVRPDQVGLPEPALRGCDFRGTRQGVIVRVPGGRGAKTVADENFPVSLSLRLVVLWLVVFRTRAPFVVVGRAMQTVGTHTHTHEGRRISCGGEGAEFSVCLISFDCSVGKQGEGAGGARGSWEKRRVRFRLGRPEQTRGASGDSADEMPGSGAIRPLRSNNH